MEETMKEAPVTITANELAHSLRAGSIDEIWNALTDEYFTGEMIPGSRRVPVDQVGREVARSGLARDRAIVVYCSGKTCPNSRQAAEKLIALGFTRVRLYEGGLEDWKQGGRGVELLRVPAAVNG
jgi:rhodanese-related sulfurtransferase